MAGVGSLVLADGDCIEVSNLNSQILFTARGLERPKTVAEAERIKALDPDIDVLAEAKVMKADDLKGAIEECTFVLGCFDRNASRLAVNRACRNMNLPACHGFDKNFSCEVFMILPGKSAFLTCALDESFPKPEKFSAVSAATDLAVVAMGSAAIRHITVIRGPMDDCWRGTTTRHLLRGPSGPWPRSPAARLATASKRPRPAMPG